ncbi:hypothetical protein Bbelb_050590 [Branchiostoma belcheri]|nr:hypothetical protein Bbelb_050590 [Branchiostoma belcheri]
MTEKAPLDRGGVPTGHGAILEVVGLGDNRFLLMSTTIVVRRVTGRVPAQTQQRSKEMGFKSEGAQRVAQSCADHHKSLELLHIAMTGTTDEMLVPYVRDKLQRGQQESISADDFLFNWCSRKRERHGTRGDLYGTRMEKKMEEPKTATVTTVNMSAVETRTRMQRTFWQKQPCPPRGRGRGKKNVELPSVPHARDRVAAHPMAFMLVQTPGITEPEIHPRTYHNIVPDKGAVMILRSSSQKPNTCWVGTRGTSTSRRSQDSKQNNPWSREEETSTDGGENPLSEALGGANRGGKAPEVEPNLKKLDADPAEWKVNRKNFPHVHHVDAWEENMEDGGKPPGMKWQLAFFSMNGTVRYVISEDSDLLGFRSLVKPVITEGIQFCFQSVFIGCILSPFGRRVQLEQKENAETVSERRVQLEQKEHYVFNYHNAKLGMSLLLTNIQDATKEGDGERDLLKMVRTLQATVDGLRRGNLSPEGEDAMDVESWIISWPGVRENRDIKRQRDQKGWREDFGIACWITRPSQLDIQPREPVSGHIAPEMDGQLHFKVGQTKGWPKALSADLVVDNQPSSSTPRPTIPQYQVCPVEREGQRLCVLAEDSLRHLVATIYQHGERCREELTLRSLTPCRHHNFPIQGRVPVSVDIVTTRRYTILANLSARLNAGIRVRAGTKVRLELNWYHASGVDFCVSVYMKKKKGNILAKNQRRPSECERRAGARPQKLGRRVAGMQKPIGQELQVRHTPEAEKRSVHTYNSSLVIKVMDFGSACWEGNPCSFTSPVPVTYLSAPCQTYSDYINLYPQRYSVQGVCRR